MISVLRYVAAMNPIHAILDAVEPPCRLPPVILLPKTSVPVVKPDYSNVLPPASLVSASVGYDRMGKRCWVFKYDDRTTFTTYDPQVAQQMSDLMFPHGPGKSNK